MQSSVLFREKENLLSVKIQLLCFDFFTIDQIAQGMNGSCVFSKLDLKWGYHQFELTPGSRDITTFVTHCGLYRYR